MPLLSVEAHTLENLRVITEYVLESVVESFGAHCITLYAQGLLCSEKRQVGSGKNRAHNRISGTEQNQK